MADSTHLTDKEPKKLELIKIVEEGDTNNYAEFATKSEAKLRAYGKWRHVVGPTAVAPTVPKLIPDRQFKAKDPDTGEEKTFVEKGNKEDVEKARAEAEPWRLENIKVLSLILDSVPPNRLYLSRGCKTAKDLWDALKEEYRPVNAHRIVTLKGQLMQYRYEPGMNMRKWTDDMRRMQHDLLVMDPTALSDEEFARHLITLMPNDEDYRYLASELHNLMIRAETKKEKLTSAMVLEKLRTEEFRLSQLHDSTTSPAGVLTARADLESKLAAAEAHRGQKRSHADVNHISLPNKRARNPSDRRTQAGGDRNQKVCQNEYCDRPARHTKEECIAYGGGKAGQYWDGYRGPRDLHLPPDERQRQRREKALKDLRGTGPSRSRQPMRSTSANTINAADHGSRSQRLPASTTDSDAEAQAVFERGETYALLAGATDEVCDPQAFRIDTSPNAAIYHDSGATRHVFYQKEIFDTYEAFSKPLNVKGFDSSLSAPAMGKGSISFKAVCDGLQNTITLSDVLHVPAARCNLVSQSQLDRRGVHSYIGNGKIHLSKNGKKIVDGQLERDLYRLNLIPVKVPPPRISLMDTALNVLNVASDKSDFYTASWDTSEYAVSRGQ
jgi:hypothetical protein